MVSLSLYGHSRLSKANSLPLQFSLALTVRDLPVFWSSGSVSASLSVSDGNGLSGQLFSESNQFANLGPPKLFG